MRHDPIEDNPATKGRMAKAEREAAAELMREAAVGPGHLGDRHARWEVQQRFLRERYGVAWRTSAKMKTDIVFD